MAFMALNAGALNKDGKGTTVNLLTSFIENYNQMKGMGFSQGAICGALIKHRNNLEDAIADCVDWN